VDEFSNATAQVNWRFQWLWLYGFVHPSTGETYWWILPFVNSQLFERVLKDFAQHWKVGPKKRVVLYQFFKDVIEIKNVKSKTIR